jgi:MOSC domain-containing protein YiiM
MTGIPVEIVLLLASPLHRYEGRPKDGALPSPGNETPQTIELRARLGIVGDRYFGRAAHAEESVTLMAIESLEAAGEELGVTELDPSRTRRNIILRGVPVDSLRGRRFSLDSGSGPVQFEGHRPANPCAWMDEQLAPGAHKALRKRGGMRCAPLNDGVLTLGPAVFELL